MKTSGIEAKVGLPAAVNIVVTVTLLLLKKYVHGFDPPPAAAVAGIVTVLTLAVGWLAPHTPRPKPPAPPPAGTKP